MEQGKKIVPAESSYYGLYLLNYLRKYYPDEVSDTYLIAEREEAAATTFEKERSVGNTVECTHERVMHVLLHGLHFSPYALLREVMENEFADEITESDRKALCNELYPHLTDLFAGYNTSGDAFTLSSEHDLLYTELMGAVIPYLESYGIQ